MKIIINPDKEIVAAVRAALADNKGYCPLQLEHLPENTCMCKWFRDQKTAGECHCGLYIKIVEDQEEQENAG